MQDFTIYVGICIQNNDPEMRGRIKIYIPQIGPTISRLKENTNVDKFFSFIGKETNNDLNSILEDLKNVLPWAEYAGPIAGGNASGRYNGFVGEGTTSDSNAWKNNQPVEGFRPAQNYTGFQAIPDAFAKTNNHKNKTVNQYAYQYTPSNYSGLARGLFSIPNVGSHVYCFHINGDRNFPVYFASAYGEEDIKRIYTLSSNSQSNKSVDYPASYENISKENTETNTEDYKTFRAKTVLNSNKHTIELIDTDLREILKFTHYSGSFKEFTNYATIELATNNDQKLVVGDQFLTVQRRKSEYIASDNEKIIGGDHYFNIGETDLTKVQDILKLHQQIHEYKLLFDVQRAQFGETTEFGNPNDMSKYQKRNGDFAICPICGGKKYNHYDPSYGIPTAQMWDEVQTINESIPRLVGSRDQLLLTALQPTPTYTFPQASHPFKNLVGYFKGMKCACCQGKGRSPSTEGGNFKKEPIKQPNSTLDQLIISLTPKLFQLEKELKNGGDEIKNITMNKVETIGTVMNDLQSFRVDPIGKLKPDGCWVAPQGTYKNFKAAPHVEYVDVADIPGGDYILTCMNKYKLLVGSRGINILTHGPLDIYGTICNFNGEQINISSNNEVLIDGGEQCTIRARKIALLPVSHNPVVVEGQLHVTRNSIFQGGIMCEGEIGLLHVTAPATWYTTDTGYWEAQSDDMTTIQAFYVGGLQATYIGAPLKPMSPFQIRLPKHYHPYQNLPLTLVANPETVRNEMIQKGINSREEIADVPQTLPISLANAVNSISATES